MTFTSFVEQIICRHGIPEEVLSDCGTNFLSTVIQEVCQLLNIKKINTSGYISSPNRWTCGKIQRYAHPNNCKVLHCFQSRLGYSFAIFVVRLQSGAQASTRESPLFLVYGRDARLPAETVLSHVRNPYRLDIDDYKGDLLANFSLAWRLAAENIQAAQNRQKKYYDCSANEINLKVGDRVYNGVHAI